MRIREQGYILLATLGALAVLTAMIGYFAARVEIMRENARALRAVAETRIAQASAYSETVFRLTTLPRTAHGFGVEAAGGVAADGRPYRIDATVVRVQDARGLVSLNTGNRGLLWSMLVLQGSTAGEADRLIDALEDYIDTDSLVRLNGAEAPTYKALDRPPPVNDWLDSTAELPRIVAWRELIRSRPELRRLFSVSLDVFVNPNTATRELLEALPGATKEGVGRLLAYRKNGAVNSAEQLAAISGIAPDPELLVFAPQDWLRVETMPVGGGPGFEYNLLLTLASGQKPWQLLEVRSLSGPPPPASDDQIVIPLAELAPAPDANPVAAGNR